MATNNGDVSEGEIIDPPYRVRPLRQFRVNASDKFAVDCPSAANHRVHMVGSRGAGGRHIDLQPQARLIRVEDEGADVTTYIEDERFGGTDQWSIVDVRRLRDGVGMMFVLSEFHVSPIVG
jgi:hypothetical protein